MDRQGRLSGFELPCAAPHDASSIEVLIDEMQAVARSGRVALASVTLEGLQRSGAVARVRPGMWLALSDGPFAAAAHRQALARLREAGARLGAIDVPREGAAFVLLQATPSPHATLLQRIAACRKAAADCEVVVTGIRTVDDMEAALAGGAAMACGFIDRSVMHLERGTMGPEAQRLGRLLQLAIGEADTRSIAQQIRPDVTLSYRLLRAANSPLLGLTRTVDTVDQALQLLGHQSLVRLLTTLLMVSAAARPSSRALQEVSLARARLMERLAGAVGGPPEALFTVGQLSLLDVMLKLPMAQALAPLGLPAPAREALLEGRGPWHILIELARHVEAGQDEEIDRIAAGLGGSALVRDAVQEAWAWAAQTSAALMGDRDASGARGAGGT